MTDSRDSETADGADTDGDVVPVHVVAYVEGGEVDVERTEDGEWVVQNHDDLKKVNCIRGMERDTAEMVGLEPITPDSTLWKESYDDLDRGEEVEIGDPYV